MKKHLHLLLCILLLSAMQTYATCPPGNTEIIVHIVPDNYYYEVSWTISDNQGQIIASADSSQGDTICVPNASCNIFTIYDSFGDGIFSPGGYYVYVNGVLSSSGAAFGSSAQSTINCPAGTYCTSPLPLTYGTHTATYDNTWYTFTPDTTGTYFVNTCGLNTCNTKIWIYQTCPTPPYLESLQGTFAYNDSSSCGEQASLHIILMANTTYYIRIGDSNDSCASSIDFEFSYSGGIMGCTDITACNYSPMATQDDGSCIYFPNPLCTGPDLQLDSASFVSSLALTTTTASTCDVTEGCVLGYGTRYVLRFTSRINNIGTLDFYIGNSASQPGMFNLNNCHGHAHYEGYGDYRLFDMNGNIIPAGHKNGYCVIDVGCFGGTGQYSCGNMGISAGCYDAYGAGTQCQWIDITDVPTGDYRVAVIINAKHLPDALGRYETNYVNNAAQVCIHIDNNPPAAPTYTILPTCTPYVDCIGVPGGNAEMDCNGICNGSGVFGDVFTSATLDSQDVYTYMDMFQSQMAATNCNDLNRDTALSVYDAALINWCRRAGPLHPSGSAHNHCNFPRNITNPTELAVMSINNVNFTQNYVDIDILHPSSNIAAYQFTMSGIAISNVVSLVNPVAFPADVRFIAATNEVICISLVDSTIARQSTAHSLVRIYFSAVTDTVICISKITDIVNSNAERTITLISGPCFASPITYVPGPVSKAVLVLIPNPANDKAFIHLSDNSGNMRDLKIMDLSGRSFIVPGHFAKDSWFELDLTNLPAGVYMVSVRGANGVSTTKLVKY